MVGQEDFFQDAMNQGHSAAWDQKWDLAADFYRKALEVQPNNPHALTNLGLALIQLKDLEGALDCYSKAAEASPQDPLPMEKVAQLNERLGNLVSASQAYFNAAELYLENREINRAIENWERVTVLSPDNIKAFTRLALVNERIGDKEKAIAAYLTLASIFQSMGNPENALRAVNRALTINPEDGAARHAMDLLDVNEPLPKPERPRGGTAALRMSQVRQLESDTEELRPETGLDPITQARQKALTILASILFDEAAGDTYEVEGSRGLDAIVSGVTGALRSPSSDHKSVVRHLSQVVDYQTKGDHLRAAIELELAMELGLVHPAANFDLGYLDVQNGRLESAMKQLNIAVKHIDFALASRLLLGDLYYQKGAVDEAAIEYLEALMLADIEVLPQKWSADIRQLYEPILETQRQSEKHEEHQQLCDNIKQLLLRKDWHNQVRLAREQLPDYGNGKSPPMPLAVILTHARSSQVLEALASINRLSEAGKIRSAMEEALYALDYAPTYLPLHIYMGELLLQHGDTDGAVAKFLTVAKTYGSRGDSTQAISLYQKITELSPMDITARGRLIDLLLISGQTDEAINEYLKMAEIYYNLADLHMSRKTYTEALRTAQQSRADRDLQVRILHHMADMDLQSLEWRQALRIFEQIRTLQPDDMKANMNLVTINFRMGNEDQAITDLEYYLAFMRDSNQGQKAVIFLEELVKEYPKSAPIRRWLAEFYEQTGRDKDAVTQLDALGELLMESENRSAATQVIQKILTFDPPNKDEYQLLLDQLQSEN